LTNHHITSINMPKRKTTAEDAPVKDTKMRDDDDESSSDVRLPFPLQHQSNAQQYDQDMELT